MHTVTVKEIREDGLKEDWHPPAWPPEFLLKDPNTEKGWVWEPDPDLEDPADNLYVVVDGLDLKRRIGIWIVRLGQTFL